MPSLKDLKNRIASVKSTRKITKAMQMVAAAKLKRAQDAATASRPYASRMASVLANLSASAGAGGPRLLAGTGDDKTHLIVVMTAERGLAGGFNSYVVKLARQKIGELRAEGKIREIGCTHFTAADLLDSQAAATAHGSGGNPAFADRCSTTSFPASRAHRRRERR